MKNFKLVACAAAVAALASGNVFAAIDLDLGTGSGGIYVGELTVSGSVTLARSQLPSGPGVADQTASVTLGASFFGGTGAYVRFSLLNDGATFVDPPSFLLNGGISQVAQSGPGFVIFAVTPVQGDLSESAFGSFVANGISVAEKGPVTLAYSLHETLVDAANNRDSLKTRTGSFLTFENAVSVTPGSAEAAVADVSATNGAYTAFTSPLSDTAAVAKVTVAHAARSFPASGDPSVISDILSDTNVITINGDFSAVGGVTLKAGNCGAQVDAGLLVASSSTSATFLVTAAQFDGELVACYTVNGLSATPVIASNYSGTVNLVGLPGFEPADGVTGTGQITRNGTVLKAAFAETPTGTFSGTVNLTNTSSNPAAFTTKCFTGTGIVVGRPGTIAANSGARFGIGSASGLGCPSSTRGLELTIEAARGGVIGSVVRQDPTTGQAAFDGMVGNQVDGLSQP